MAVTALPRGVPARYEEPIPVQEVRARLSEEMQYVMDHSRPFPSQEELCKVIKKEMDVLDTVTPDNPVMPPLHVQYELLYQAYEGEAKTLPVTATAKSEK